MEEKKEAVKRSQPASLRADSYSTARWAGVAVKGMCSHLGDRAPAERKRDVLLKLAHENVRRQTRRLERERR